MTPDRRLDQLEPLVADVLQKVDRLIEGQGQLFDLVARIDQKADLALGKADQAMSKADLAAQKADIAAQKADIAAQKADLAAKGVADLTISTQQQYADLKSQLIDLKAGQQKLETGFEVLKAGQQTLENGFEVLKAGQDAILQYLKERLP